MNIKELESDTDYTTKELSAESKSFAGWIMVRMDELCIRDLCGLKLRTITANHGQSNDVLLLNDEDLSSSMGIDSYFLFGDYHCEINRPCRDTVDEFREMIPEIIATLEELATPVEFPKIPE